jgi:hypothetical protein
MEYHPIRPSVYILRGNGEAVVVLDRMKTVGGQKREQRSFEQGAIRLTCGKHVVLLPQKDLSIASPSPHLSTEIFLNVIKALPE